MPLNIRKVEQPLLAPFVVVNVSSKRSAIDADGVHGLLREWTNSALPNGIPESQWAGTAEHNKLVFEAEKGKFPIDVTRLYEGQNRWATILVQSPDKVELNLGHTIKFENLPTAYDVAESVEWVVTRLPKYSRGRRFWQGLDISAEIMINRASSNIKLSQPRSFARTLVSSDVPKSFVPLGVTVVGVLIPKFLGSSDTGLARLALVPPAAIAFILAYVIVGFFHWFSSRSDLRWVLGRD